MRRYLIAVLFAAGLTTSSAPAQMPNVAARPSDTLVPGNYKGSISGAVGEVYFTVGQPIDGVPTGAVSSREFGQFQPWKMRPIENGSSKLMLALRTGQVYQNLRMCGANLCGDFSNFHANQSGSFELKRVP